MSAPGIFRPPPPRNEPVHDYAPGSPEREEVRRKIVEMRGDRMDLPMVIGGEDVRSGDTFEQVEPHEKASVLANVHQGGAPEVERAIAAAGEAWPDWSRLPWEERAAVFLRAAELLAGPWRSTLVAATMLGQSKTVHQAEIDAACELIDFLRFNVEFMTRIYEQQPVSSPGVWNRMEYRPLEGFVFAVTPFNFTAIGGNLPSSAALMGNTVVWKPASTAAYSAHFVMRLFQEAGLPPGVINLVYGPGAAIGDPALASDRPRGRALHRLDPGLPARCGGRSATNIARYRNYPRLVGETGGKDFIFAHPSADVDAVATAIVRGALRVPGAEVLGRLARLRAVEPVAGAARAARRAGRRAPHGRRRRLPNFMGAVIDAKAQQRPPRRDRARARARRHARSSSAAASTTREGFFVEPTVIETSDPDMPLMREELFGPIVTTYVYPESRWEETLELVDRTAPYALTGAVFADDRAAVIERRRRAALRGRQLLRQRQADGRGGRPAALRRRPRVGHQRQGGLDVEPDPLGQPADDQGDVRPAARLPLPVHGRRPAGLRRQRLGSAGFALAPRGREPECTAPSTRSGSSSTTCRRWTGRLSPSRWEST